MIKRADVERGKAFHFIVPARQLGGREVVGLLSKRSDQWVKGGGGQEGDEIGGKGRRKRG